VGKIMNFGVKGNKSITRINPFQEIQKTELIWKELAEKFPPSFFNSWGWVNTWLTCLPKSVNIEFIVHFGENNTPICCYFLGIKNSLENIFFYKKRAYLNSTGYEEFDNLTVEYNSPLIANNTEFNEISLLSSLEDIEEFHIPVSPLKYGNIDEKFLSRITSLPSFWVDLDKVKENSNDYTSLISKNKRNQIKRSIKEYQKDGDIKIDIAKNVKDANQMLDELAVLHQKEWIQRGKPGAFTNQFFCEFHHKLIEDRFFYGEIQLLKIYNDSEVIGYIYNFIFNKEVLFYQCGFNYKEGNNYRPGIVSHYFSILLNCELNNKKYNFLVGKSQYKKSLSTNSDMLHSIIFCRKNIKSRIEYILREVKKKKGLT
jgi:hypothetical protein